MLFYLTILLTVIFWVVYKLADKYDWEVTSLINLSCGVVFTLVLAIMTVIVSVENVGNNGKIASNQQRYQALVYELKDDAFNSGNIMAKKELYDQVRKWNEDLAKNKANQYDFWIGPFIANIYDQFELIPLEGE